MTTLPGLAASPGIAEGRAYIYRNTELIVYEKTIEDVAGEIDRIHRGFGSAVEELVSLKGSVGARMGDDFAHIFRSQQTIAEDEGIIEEILDVIRQDHINAESALGRIFGNYLSLFSELEDGDYNKSRAVDIEDVYKRVLRILLGVPATDLSSLPDNSILVARDLFPSDTAMMDTQSVAGLVTEMGGATSHVAILANNLGIPAAVGVREVLDSVRDEARVILDSADLEKAWVYIDPSDELRRDIKAKMVAWEKHAKMIREDGEAPTVTTDGQAIILSANVGSKVELETALNAGAKSVGLFRSEFLFMNLASLPGEEEQYIAYRHAAECFKSGFVIVRTLDVGGDKHLPALNLPDEENPFLGNRALRLTLSRPKLFLTQIRAILRAGAHGSVKIMFPMVGGVPELELALDLMNVAAIQLDREGLAYDGNMERGIMVEIPSAVWSAEALARRVSFFSIGTNDLTQYMLAADRLNSEVSEYYRTFDPSIFKAIRQVVSAADARGCRVGICGELGGNPLAIPLLVGLGVSELSMSPRAMAEASWIIRRMSRQDAESLAEGILKLEKDYEIRAVLREYYNSKGE